MQWHPYSDEAFARARERGTPVLVHLLAGWSRGSRELDRRVLTDLRVLGHLSEHFVCVRVDREERPEVSERLRLGGWPTLAWLDAEGTVLARTGYLEPGPLAARLQAVTDHHREGPISVANAFAAIAETEATARPEDGLDGHLVEEVMEVLHRSADPVHGGWGKRQKFPHPDALHLALVRWSQTGDEDVLRLVTRTLRGMQQGEVHDRVEGGFYRYATQADWSVPHHQKMLRSNAQRLLAYVEAFQALGDTTYRETAEGILTWMTNTLLDPRTGAYRASQDADPEYAHKKSIEQRAAHGSPECDPTIYADRNAVAIHALFKAGLVFDDERWTEAGRTALDFLLDRGVTEHDGVFHHWDGAWNVHGLLADQASVLRAMVEAMHYAGDNRYLKPALQLAHRTLECFTAADGTLHANMHKQTPRGSIHENSDTLLANSVCAEACVRLGTLAYEPELVDAGRRILAAFSGDWRRYGHLAAVYARAVDLFVHPPVHVIVVGPADGDRTRALRRTALRPYVASRVVQTLDPERDPQLLEKIGLPTPTSAHAYVQCGFEAYADTADPDRLAPLMARIQRD
jgi:uncharacterized protein